MNLQPVGDFSVDLVEELFELDGPVPGSAACWGVRTGGVRLPVPEGPAGHPKGGLYLQGLILDGRRKSMQPIGGLLGIDYQQLQQFVSSSSWPIEPVRRVLAAKAVGLVGPEAWVVVTRGLPRTGRGGL
jgi:hypothetical protein